MTGPRKRFLYQIVPQLPSNTLRRCFAEVDEDSVSLTLNGVVNSEASASSAGATYDFLIPAGGARKVRNISARRVRVDYTGDLPSGRTNPVNWIVVFSRPVYDQYAVGQVGTYLGLPVVCVAKEPGTPG